MKKPAERTVHEEDDSREILPAGSEEVVQKVRERYGRIADGLESGCGAPSRACCTTSETETAGRIGYDPTQLDALPEGSNMGLGCGAPVGLLELEPGEVVLDLGSGGGLDVFLAAPRVGTRGRVIGVDMTDEMIAKARANAAKAGLSQVEFRLGRLEDLPVEDASVDAVTSNCVINLVPDKARVFREVARVLKPGGRLVVSDIILDGRLPQALEKDLLAYVGCLAGAMQRETYFALVAASGLTDVAILEDVDYLAAVGELLPEEVLTLLGRTGWRVEDIAGLVRSVTFRAVKPAPAR